MRLTNSGFTLIELLIVIAILGILTTIILLSVSSAVDQADIAKAKAETKNLYNIFAIFESDTGVWPGHQPNCALVQVNDNEYCDDGCSYSLNDDEAGLIGTDGSYSNWQGPYIKSIHNDPWGNEYFFDTDYDLDGDPNNGSEIWAAVIGSYGPDGVGNNQYNSDDIVYIICRE